jgi:hypothetical protein
MTVELIKRNVYGKELLYPQCKNAKIFANIAGTKTISTYILHEIKNLGIHVVIKYE